MRSMPDDWEWFWSSEYGRDKLLRREVESLSYQASAAASRASRMQSQLAKLQGSLASRLDALSEAFDAYVELGDVREELAGYPDTSAIRRDVMSAIEALSKGLPAEPVDARGLDYWLPYAMNTVIGIATGKDEDAGSTTTPSSPDAEFFIVAAAGALGHGDRVADRLPQLLITDREFTGNQVVLINAVIAGVYGPILDSLEPAVGPTLRGLDQTGWLVWTEQAADTSDRFRVMEWLRDQLAEPSSSNQPPDQATQAGAAGSAEAEHLGSDPRASLRTAVSRLIGAGYGEEGALLERSRQLRWQIEHPGQTRAELEDGPAPMSVLDWLRYQLRTLPVGSPEHRTLLRWLAPHLATTIDPLAAAPAPAQAEVSVRTYNGSVDVTAAGPDAARWQQILTNVEQSGVVPPGKLYGYAITAGVSAVLALVLALVGQPVLAVLVIIAAVIFGVLCVLQLRARQQAADSAKVALDQAHNKLNEGVERAKAADAAALESAQERTRLADHLRLELGRLSSAETKAAAG